MVNQKINITMLMRLA